MKVLNSLFKDLTDEQKDKVLEFIKQLYNPVLPSEQESLNDYVIDKLIFLPDEIVDAICDLHNQEVDESYDDGYEAGCEDIEDSDDRFGV